VNYIVVDSRGQRYFVFGKSPKNRRNFIALSRSQDRRLHYIFYFRFYFRYDHPIVNITYMIMRK